MNIKIIKQQNVSLQCIVCGLENEASLRTQFLETEGGVLVAVPYVNSRHQSYPNRMHGGVIAALLDEVVGRAYQIEYPDMWGVTAGLEVRYSKPVALEQQVYVVGRITQGEGRMFEGTGEIYLAESGELLASAFAKYVKLPVEKIASADFLHTQWVEDRRAMPDIRNFAMPKRRELV